MALSGTMLIPGEDYGLGVDVVDVDVNGSTIYISYISNGNLKVKAYSTVQNVDRTLPIFMSGCSLS
jgi:hypothetical protein